MCRRHGQRRQPLTVQLGLAAYNAYQSHRARRLEEGQQGTKAIEPEHFETVTEPKYVPEQTLSEAFRGLELHEKGIPPPSYEEVIVNRTELPVRARSFDKQIDALGDFDSDSESETEAEVRPEGVKRGDSWKLAKKEWKALKAARREEKRRVKAEIKAMWREKRVALREQELAGKEERRRRKRELWVG